MKLSPFIKGSWRGFDSELKKGFLGVLGALVANKIFQKGSNYGQGKGWRARHTSFFHSIRSSGNEYSIEFYGSE